MTPPKESKKKVIKAFAIVDEFGNIVGDNNGPFKQSIIFRSEQRAADFSSMFHSFTYRPCTISYSLPNSLKPTPKSNRRTNSKKKNK